MNYFRALWLRLRWQWATSSLSPRRRLYWFLSDAKNWWLHKLYQLKLRKTSPYLTDTRNILLPMIRQVIPNMIAHDLMGVQPMTGEVGQIFTLRYTPTNSTAEIDAAPKEGTTRHVFGQGWQRYYGGEWIPDEVYWKLKIKGVI